ncbi:MAG: protein-glutamate methylesterase/protein-glutamine glutaminase [Christensenellales bacterium]|jgi:two-component system chemotaxis response regulator CheB
MRRRKIRVLVVDDSIFVREFIASKLSEDDGIEVVGKAVSAFDAKDKTASLRPDVMTLDINMPQMDGIEFLRQLMPQDPLPVVVVSSVSSRVFDALNAGAVDFVTKSSLKDDQEQRRFIMELATKIKIASIAKIGQSKNAAARCTLKDGCLGHAVDNAIIAIGASTGGTEAIQTILKDLGRDLPGIVIVQHMPPVFTKLYAERLNSVCAMEVKEAEDGDAVLPGRALVARGGQHMTVIRRASGLFVECKEGEKISGHCPSVDALFSSVAKLKGINSLGIILTGMGSDGAKGLLEMKNAGARTFGQDQQTCVVYGMPAVAERIGAVDVQLPIQDMAAKIYEWRDGL